MGDLGDINIIKYITLFNLHVHVRIFVFSRPLKRHSNPKRRAPAPNQRIVEKMIVQRRFKPGCQRVHVVVKACVDEVEIEKML